MDIEDGNKHPKHPGGPRSAEGKAVSRRNALKHGGRASTLIPELVGEDRFSETLRALHLELEPEGIVEESLVRQLAQTSLTFDLAATGVRAIVREMQRLAPAGSSNDSAITLALSNLKLALAVRYQSDAGRNFQKIFRLFQEIKSQRLSAQEDDTIEPPSETEPTPQAVEAAHPAGRLATLLSQVSTEADCRSFIEKARNEFAASRGGPTTSSCNSDSIRNGCFLANTGTPLKATLCVAILWVNDRKISIAALRSGSGIQRERTLTKLLRLICDADRNGNDFLLQYVRKYFETD